MFIEHKKTISDGALVLLYINPRSIYPVQVTSGKFFDHKHGRFAHDQMIGSEYGVQLYSHNGRGSVYLLHPSCERWTLSLPHRTQIIYTPDIAQITSLLNVEPNQRVVESGTGSASLTHAFARSVAPDGQVFTFEYHSERAAQAQAECKAHEIDKIVTVTQRNVYTDGFAPTAAPGTVHAVFLDLPEPWKAIPHTPQLFVKTRANRICCFSPCIEQVQKTRGALIANGFSDVTTFECLQTKWEARTVDNPSIVNSITGPSNAMTKQEQLAMKRRRNVELSSSNSSTANVDSQDDETRIVPMVPGREGKGHTAYLTFATFLPDVVER